jgi:hypothetical protein
MAISRSSGAHGSNASLLGIALGAAHRSRQSITPLMESETASTSKLSTPARPMAARMRPQLGSEANSAVFHQGRMRDCSRYRICLLQRLLHQKPQ